MHSRHWDFRRSPPGVARYTEWCEDEAVAKQYEIKNAKAKVEDLKAVIDKESALRSEGAQQRRTAMNATSRINEDQADGAYGLTARYTRVLGLWVRLGGDPTVHPYTIVQYSYVTGYSTVP